MTAGQTRIVWLDARADADDQALGPKAFGLVRLSRNGLPVPVGFCIPIGAYWEHIGIHGIIRQIGSAQDLLASDSLDQRKSTLLAIREAIVSAPITEATRQAIETHYRKLGTAYAAVRSSATAEDLPGQSFAGQYDTCLGITDIDECLAAIKQCWASLWTERAWNYRQQNGLDHLAVGMAVIVQSLVRANASGVLFTADPSTGRSDRITIEACWGLGEALVSGRVTPDRFFIRKHDLHLLAKTISDKGIESVLDQHGGIRQQPVAPERRSHASIERRTAIRLARFAKRAEAKLGGPQDMEWAVQGRRIFFLQSRPITTLPGAGSWEDRQVWTNANLGEVLPDVMTPMTASFTRIADETLFGPVLEIFGLENVYQGKFERFIAGRLYFNASMGQVIIQYLPGAQRFDYQALLGGGQAAATERVEAVPGLRISMVKMLLRIPRSIRSAVAHRSAKARQSIQELQKVNCYLQDLDFSRMSQEELGRRFTILMQDGLRRLDLLYAVLVTSPLAIFYKLCERWLDDTNDSLANSLLADTGDMASARAGSDLWRLAVQAQAAPQVHQILLSEETWDTVHERLSASNAGREFLRGWNQFMACHGHHCRGELELCNPRWSETPDYVLDLLRGYQTQSDGAKSLHDRQERHRRHEQLRQRCLQQLRSPVKRIVFDHLLRAARSGSALRENFKNEAIRWIATLRRMLLAVGVKLTEAGVFAEPDDVFFLEWQELEALLHRASNLDVGQTVAARRAEYEKNKSITPPKVVVGRFDPDEGVSEPEPASEDADLLRGVAASAGIATGKARVILRADTSEQVQAGEILVAPFTDPGWTPYFVPAAGIVTDQGGLLSHGSIIAREYGIPAVVNVPAATKIIQTGQMIRVDGNRGIVTILR